MDTTRQIFTRVGRLGDDDDRLEVYEAWDKLGDSVRFQEAWNLVVQAHTLAGKDIHELRFQRSIENIYRK